MSTTFDLSAIFANVADFIVAHKIWFIAGGAVLAVLVLSLIIAAAAGAFAPAVASTVRTFNLTSITAASGTADSNVSVLGTYVQLDDLAAYSGTQVEGEEIVAAWKLTVQGQTTEKFFTYAKVTATGKYVAHLVSVANGVIFSTEPASPAAGAPASGTGAWSRVKASTVEAVGPRTFAFETPATVTLMRMSRAVKTNLVTAAQAVRRDAARLFASAPVAAGAVAPAALRRAAGPSASARVKLATHRAKLARLARARKRRV